MRYLTPLDLRILVEPRHLLAQFARYRSGRLERTALVDWASHLLLIDAYVWYLGEDDAEADRLEPVWQVVEEMAAPAIHGSITPERVGEWVGRLERLEVSPGEGSPLGSSL